jgi:hypothetical protein
MYEAFGLKVLSEIELPECTRISEGGMPADVEIIIGNIPEDWEHEGSESDYLAVKVKSNQLLLTIHHVATYVIQEGKRILVSPVHGSDEAEVRVYLLGSCMGALLMQRKILPLHGSAVVIDGMAYAIVGESGAGKSTLAAALLNQGYPLLSDDVIALSLSPDGMPVVTPSYPQQKLWQESIDLLGLEEGNYRPLYHEITKYAVPVHNHYRNEPVPLAGVFEIVKSECKELEVRHLEGIERLPVFIDHTYRNYMIPQLRLEQWHFSTVSKIVSQIQVCQLRRPFAGCTVHELVSEIKSNTKGVICNGK